MSTEAPAEAPEKKAEPEHRETFLSHFLRNLWSANTVTVTVLSIVLALVIGAILIVVSDSRVALARNRLKQLIDSSTEIDQVGHSMTIYRR